MGNSTSNTHPQPSGISSALDSGMMSMLGQPAAKPYDPPKYDKSGVGLARARRGAEEGETSCSNELNSFELSCHVSSFVLLFLMVADRAFSAWCTIRQALQTFYGTHLIFIHNYFTVFPQNLLLELLWGAQHGLDLVKAKRILSQSGLNWLVW